MAALAVVACNDWFVMDLVGTAAMPVILVSTTLACFAGSMLLAYLAFTPLRIDPMLNASSSAFDSRSGAARYNAAHPAGR